MVAQTFKSEIRFYLRTMGNGFLISRFISHLKEGSLVGLADGLHVDDVDEEDEGEFQEGDKAQHRGEEQAHPADSLTEACFLLCPLL